MCVLCVCLKCQACVCHSGLYVVYVVCVLYIIVVWPNIRQVHVHLCIACIVCVMYYVQCMSVVCMFASY